MTSPAEGIRPQPVVAPVAPATTPASATASAAATFAQTVAAQTDAPPAELLAELDAAAVVAATLEAGRRQLHFEVDKRTGILEVEVRDSAGHVVRRIPPTEALQVALGAPVDGPR